VEDGSALLQMRGVLRGIDGQAAGPAGAAHSDEEDFFGAQLLRNRNQTQQAEERDGTKKQGIRINQ
jgi:hypothetical protein